MKRRNSLRAFSLVEMMIALVILGLGLLFIAAALPAGVDYSRDTVDQINGEAAADFALDTLEGAIATSSNMFASSYWKPGYGRVSRVDSVHRPREGNLGDLPTPPTQWKLTADATWPGETVPRSYEPLIKVRPFVLMNAEFAGQSDTSRYKPLVDHTEAAISQFLGTQLLTVAGTATNPFREADFPNTGTFYPDPGGIALADNPLLTILSRVYPPPTPAIPFEFDGSVVNLKEGRFFARDSILRTDARFNIDREKSFDRRLAWTAFYRRASYAPGSDPLLYEVIVLVTRRPTLSHRFAFQDLNPRPDVFNKPRAFNAETGPAPVGDDRLAPTPWLVTFKKLPAFPKPTEYIASAPFPPVFGTSVAFLPNYVAPPKLTFECEPEVAKLLPPGAIFIPARNDDLPQGLGGRVVGYLPTSPAAAPIYRVIDRPNDTTVVVENNGLVPFGYPGTFAASPTTAAAQWPVWVIPPAFSQRERSNSIAPPQPLYDRQSPVVSISRRFVTLDVR